MLCYEQSQRLCLFGRYSYQRMLEKLFHSCRIAELIFYYSMRLMRNRYVYQNSLACRPSLKYLCWVIFRQVLNKNFFIKKRGNWWWSTWRRKCTLEDKIRATINICANSCLARGSKQFQNAVNEPTTCSIIQLKTPSAASRTRNEAGFSSLSPLNWVFTSSVWSWFSVT